VDTYLQDRLAIADLMTGWMHRDLAEWDQLRALFHADAVIEITWFEGNASDFVDGSMRMGASDLRTKHLVAAPVVVFRGSKAIAETNAMIIAENSKLRVGCSVHCRFLDEVEKRAGFWKIVKRQAVYDMGSFTFPLGIVDLDAETIQKYPSEYAALAYLLDNSDRERNECRASIRCPSKEHDVAIFDMGNRFDDTLMKFCIGNLIPPKSQEGQGSHGIEAINRLFAVKMNVEIVECDSQLVDQLTSSFRRVDRVRV
jgi:SnoaL-like domain